MERKRVVAVTVETVTAIKLAEIMVHPETILIPRGGDDSSFGRS